MKIDRFNIKYSILLLLILLVGLSIVYAKNTINISPGTANLKSSGYLAISPKVQITLPYVQVMNIRIPVELATSSSAIQKGLSSRLELEANKGMLFIFPKSAIYKFWMPDMHFPIDIIWINDNKIVDITRNVSTDFDPAKPKFYKSSHPARYVLEVNAGFTERAKIIVGGTVIFKNI